MVKQQRLLAPSCGHCEQASCRIRFADWQGAATMGWLRSNRPEGRLADIRAARRKQGHELTLLQEAIVLTIAGSDPKIEPASNVMLEEIKTQIGATGVWHSYDEWRISTSFDNRIVKGEMQGKPWLTVTVSCDGQILSCGCPTVDRAFGFMRLYQKLIIDQFYSVGPPWADQSLFHP